MERDGIIFRRRLMTTGVDRSGATGNQAVVLYHIHDYYKKALQRLPPELIPSLLEAGFCFGFLDPVSNIIANTVSHELDKGRENKKRSRAGNEKKGESRRTAISKIITKSSKSSRLMIRQASDSSISARSLRGLVIFLTSYFPHLTTWDALRYLRLSKSDLLVAVHLIQQARGTHTFTIKNPTVKIALGCAAISALHPAPAVATLVSRSFQLAYRVDEASNLLKTQSCISRSTIVGLFELLTSTKDTTNRESPIQHAIRRLQHMNMKSITRLQQRKKELPVGFGLQISLEMVLLDKIHLLYLEAVSCIPTYELCSRHHRGLLKAGHCYGPCDPVTNIILNTLWYDAMFPPQQHFEVEMICTKSLVRIEFLSLCGLVAYIRVRFPAFSVYEAMRRLLICNANLDSVIEMAKTEGHDEYIPFSESLAYYTASHAAHHPNPDALVEFATTVMPQVGGTPWIARTVMPQVGETPRSTPEVKRVLSSSDVHAICQTLSQKLPPGKLLKKVRKLSGAATKIVSVNCDKFKACQDAIVKMVEAALLRYSKQVGDEYELHVICGVNSTIPQDGECYCPHSYSYPLCHMNIWARQKGSQNDDADQVPTLFFIQCSNSDEHMQDVPFLCCPISDLSEDAGRCYHCEHDGIKIVHPSSEIYLGRCKNFEDMARGASAVDIQELVEQGQMNTLFDRPLEYEDSIYFDPDWDVEFSKFINQAARDQAWWEKMRKKQHPGSVDYSWIDKLVYEKSLAWSAELI